MNDGAATELYDAFAAEYDDAFETHPLRRIYETIAWEFAEPLLPPSPGTVVDVGCGTGRAAGKCLAAGHRVIGVEPSQGMRQVLARKFGGEGFTLLACGAEDADVAPGSADLVLALGSIQYCADPAAALRRMGSWLRPGGAVCLYVDGLVALTLELLRLGRAEEALRRLADGWGVFSYGAHAARLNLYDRAGLTALLAGAGFADIETRGLLICPSALGRAACLAAAEQDEAALMALERRLSAAPAMADAGKHVMAWGRLPP